jgi:hypothetical protein
LKNVPLATMLLLAGPLGKPFAANVFSKRMVIDAPGASGSRSV